MKNAVFWDVAPCGSCKNLPSSETSVLRRATLRNISEYDILNNRLLTLIRQYFLFQNAINELVDHRHRSRKRRLTTVGDPPR
jgi:hypothetical protein